MLKYSNTKAFEFRKKKWNQIGGLIGSREPNWEAESYITCQSNT